MSMWEIPAIVLALVMWLQSPPINLADASRREALRRQMMPKATKSLTNDDVERQPRRTAPTPPAAPEPAAAAPESAETAKKPEEAHDEAWWRERMTTAQAALERDRLLEESLQSRVNALTSEWSARDDPAQRQLLYEQRARVLSELERMKDQILADQKTIEEIQEDARRQSVPPGWIR